MAKKPVTLDLGDSKTEETPVEETPAEETPAEETPAEEVSTDPTPSDVITESSKVDPEGAKFVKAPDDDIWLLCVHSYCVYDPYTDTRFIPGIPRFVTRMGSYTRNQLEAGLLQIVPAPTAGE